VDAEKIGMWTLTGWILGGAAGTALALVYAARALPASPALGALLGALLGSWIRGEDRDWGRLGSGALCLTAVAAAGYVLGGAAGGAFAAMAGLPLCLLQPWDVWGMLGGVAGASLGWLLPGLLGAPLGGLLGLAASPLLGVAGYAVGVRGGAWGAAGGAAAAAVLLAMHGGAAMLAAAYLGAAALAWLLRGG